MDQICTSSCHDFKLLLPKASCSVSVQLPFMEHLQFPKECLMILKCIAFTRCVKITHHLNWSIITSTLKEHYLLIPFAPVFLNFPIQPPLFATLPRFETSFQFAPKTCLLFLEYMYGQKEQK